MPLAGELPPLFDDLERRNMEYPVSVPFTRFADLKAAV